MAIPPNLSPLPLQMPIQLLTVDLPTVAIAHTPHDVWSVTGSFHFTQFFQSSLVWSVG